MSKLSENQDKKFKMVQDAIMRVRGMSDETTKKKKWQVILQVGAEGGCISLLGAKFDKKGWQFCLSTEETTLKSILDEEDQQGLNLAQQSSIITGFNNAIYVLDEKYNSWTDFLPLQVSPNFAKSILESVKERCTDHVQLEAWMQVITTASSIPERLKNKLSSMSPLSIVNLRDLYSDFEPSEFDAVRAALYNLSVGTPVSRRSNSSTFFAIRLNISYPDGSKKKTFLSLPGIPRNEILDDTPKFSTIGQCIDGLCDKYGKETIEYWGNSAQYRSVDQARKQMKSAVSRDRKSCKICDLLKSNGQNIPSSPVSACHIISRKATFWKILSEVDALKGNIFCDEAVALLKKRLKSNRFHSDEQYMIALCAQHDKIFTDSLKNTISSEKVERMGQTVEEELQLSLFG